MISRMLGRESAARAGANGAAAIALRRSRRRMGLLFHVPPERLRRQQRGHLLQRRQRRVAGKEVLRAGGPSETVGASGLAGGVPMQQAAWSQGEQHERNLEHKPQTADGFAQLGHERWLDMRMDNLAG